MDINRKDFLRGAAIVSLMGSIGGVGLSTAGATVSAPTKASNSSTSAFITSKLASPYSANYSKQISTLKMTGASVLTNGANSTLVMSFNKNVTKNDFINDAKTYKGHDLNFNLFKQVNASNYDYDELTFDINSSKLTIFPITGEYKSIPAAIRYSGNTVSIDFSKNAFNIGPNDDFSAGFSYAVDIANPVPHFQNFTYRSTDVKTKNFSMDVYMPTDG